MALLQGTTGTPVSIDGKVLVVDDEPEVRNIISRGLPRHDLPCSTAANAQEALAIATAEPPILAIVDIRMPGHDGIWLLEQYKERWPDMAVIMLTGVSEAQTAIQCLRRGADDYLMKPIDLEELATVAQRAVEKRRLTLENREYQSNLEKMVAERTAQLNGALQVIEGTYQATLAALVGAHRIDAPPSVSSIVPKPNVRVPSDGLKPERFSSRQITPSSVLPPVDKRIRPSVPDQQGDDQTQDQTVELAALRSAGELICQGSSHVELAEAMASELVDRAGAQFARLWLPARQAHGFELAVDKGTKGGAGLTLAEKAASRCATQVETGGKGGLASVPILVRGRVEGVLEVGWKEGTRTDLAALAERLAVFLSVSLARQQDAEEWRKTTRELDLFYGMASATRYTLDLQHVTEFIMNSLHKIVNYDMAGLLLLEEPASLNIQTSLPVSEDLISRVRTHIQNTLRLTCGLEVRSDLHTQVSRVETPGQQPREIPDKLRSFVNIPLTVEGSVAGLIHVSSGRENAFTEEEIRFLNRVANFLASAVQGVRDILATMKGRMESMVDHMMDGVLMLEGSGEVVAINEAARRILRVDSTWGRGIDARQLSKVLEFDPLALMGEERRSLRKIVSVHGIAYQAQLSPVESVGRDQPGVVMAFRNFTREKKVDEMKSEFINIVSHELRTPLTAIKNAVALLVGPRLGELNDKQKHFVRLAQRNLDLLISMINDLLDLSKIEAGKVHIAFEALNLRESIETAVSSLGPKAEGKEIVLETAIAADLPRINGDAASIQRVLVNLLGNALKFTAKGGKVRVEASSTWEEVGMVRRPAVTVAVADTGVGIPKEQLELIFDKFHQVDGNPSGETGTGLGLPIARELIMAHHGRLWAESELGRGTRIVFVIPVLNEEQLFFRRLESDLDRARELQAPLALVVVRTTEEKERLVARLGDEQYRALLDTLGASAQNAARRSTDRVELRRERAEVIAVLLETSREGGQAFGARLVGDMMEEMKAKSKDYAGVELNWACAVFPNEAATADRLYRLTVERTNEGAATTVE